MEYYNTKRTIAIFTDVHGLLEPLKAILEDIKQKGITEIYCLGDFVGVGPNPTKTNPIDFQNKEQPTKPIISGAGDDGLDVEMTNYNQSGNNLNRPIIHKSMVEEKMQQKATEQPFQANNPITSTLIDNSSHVSEEIELLKTAKIDLVEIQRQMALEQQKTMMGSNQGFTEEYEEEQDHGMSM